MTDTAPQRLGGSIWKRNSGILRAWHRRAAVVTAEGFFVYKKQAKAHKSKKIDLVKTAFAATIVQANGYYYFELQCGSAQMAIGFLTEKEARLWLSGMMEVADENSAGRRVWIANLRRMLTFKLRERRELVPAMAERDWFSEWNFCLRSLNDENEPIMSRQRRLRRLHTIWLQFELFSELVAEIFFASIQQRDARGLARIKSFEHAASPFFLTGKRPDLYQKEDINSGKDRDLRAEGSRHNDVDEMKLAGIQFEFASKSWQGHKRLAKQMALFARFRSLIESFLSENIDAVGILPPLLHAALSKLPTFPLISAFSIRGVSVVTIAEPLQSERSTLMTIDTRDLVGLITALRETKMLQFFPHQELPELVVRQFPGQTKPTLVNIHSRFEDVLVNSLRSSMVHGVLIRAGHNGNDSRSRVEVLSAHDVKEIVECNKPQWIPYLDLIYYQLNSEDCPVENSAGERFLLQSGSCTCPALTGDVVITFDAKSSKLPLDLPEAFVRTHELELHSLVRKLQELKKNAALFTYAASNSTLSRSQSRHCRRLDTSMQVAREYEDGVKKLFVQHIREFAAQLVTLGDTSRSSACGSEATRRPQEPTNIASQSMQLKRSKTMSSMPRPHDVFASSCVSTITPSEIDSIALPRLQQRTSSLSSIALTNETTELATQTIDRYVIDTLHLRQTLREGGVNLRFLPLVFQFLNSSKQRGIQVLVASEIIARIAKVLFRYRMCSVATGQKSRWKSRKARLIQFIDSIMHGLFHKNVSCAIQECSGDQFWDIDGPIWYFLGPFASSFAMDQKVSIDLVSKGACLDKYRDLLKVNPSVLFNHLLYVFQARLTTSILPDLRENRFVSMPFLRTEADLTFNYEKQDSKLAIHIHENLLWSHLHFFHVQYETLKPGLPLLNQQANKRGLTSWIQYYHTLSAIFRQNLGLSQPTRLEHAIQAWQDLTFVRVHLTLALHAAIGDSCHSIKDNKTLSCIQKDCHCANERMVSSKALFPVEYKFALQCLELVSTGNDLTKAMEESDELLERLRFFYRPANLSQFCKDFSSHPIFSLFHSVGSTELITDEHTAADLSLREKFQRQQWRQLWMLVMSDVNAYCRQIEAVRQDPVALAATRAILCEMKYSDNFHLDFSRTTQDHPLRSKPQNSTKPSSMYSSQGDALWFIECFFLPPLTTNSLLVAGDALVSNQEISSRLTSTHRQPDDNGPVPGLALMWGNAMGLSLEDEAQINNKTQASTLSLLPRPETAASIRFISIPPPLRRVVQLACGYRHTALITDDRQLYTFGYGECGRLGHGTEENCVDPKPVAYFSNLMAAKGVAAGVVDVSCGREHTMVVIANGDLFGFGWGEAGRLGTGETGSELHPSQVKLSKITAVACGREHTLALTDAGQVFAFGAGFGGRLGTGFETDEELPVLVKGLDGYNITTMDAGECHSCALSVRGEVLTWGFGHSGALGHNNRRNCLEPTLVAGPWITNDLPQEKTRLNEAVIVTSIACGGYHTLATTSNGVLYGWGDAAAGQLGPEHAAASESVVLCPAVIRLPTRAGAKHRSISCGTFTSALCDTLGQLFVWGSPAAGNGASLSVDDANIQRVDVLHEFEFAQVACGAYHVVAITRKLEYC